jgi:hypothetical protein
MKYSRVEAFIILAIILISWGAGSYMMDWPIAGMVLLITGGALFVSNLYLRLR